MPKTPRNKLPGNDIPSFIDYVLDGITDRNLVLGPLVWQPSDGAVAKRWYFRISGCGPKGWRTDCVVCDGNDRDALRAEVLMHVAMVGRPVVIHDCDDELYEIKRCETLWPGERVTRIRKAIEAERAAASPA
jgi:hypothetical protein